MTRRRKRPEDVIQRAVLEHLRLRGPRTAYWFHVANGGGRSPIEAAILKSLGVQAGVPDLIIIYDGKTYGLELKADGNKPTKLQIETQDAMRAAGAEVAVAIGLDAALQQLEQWQLLRGRASREDFTNALRI
jgi:hypothetical protein